MVVINKPIFNMGQVIDLSYKHSMLPIRVVVKSVFMRESDNGEWVYKVYAEDLNKEIVVYEKTLKQRMINSRLKVYSNEDVKNMYANGFRFCGNYAKSDALVESAKIATNNNVRNIILKPALNAYGGHDDGKYGIWIRYNISITNDGVIVGNSEQTDTIVIK